MKKSEDLTRKCKKGHEPNWYIAPSGWQVCRECRRNQVAQFKKRNPDKVKATQKAARNKRIEYYQEYDRKRNQTEERKRYKRNLELVKRYGITLEEYEKRIDEQNRLCPICQKELKPFTKHGASVDHCHNSLQIRGILCNKCNSLLGFVNDDVDSLKRAIQYLGSE